MKGAYRLLKCGSVGKLGIVLLSVLCLCLSAAAKTTDAAHTPYDTQLAKLQSQFNTAAGDSLRAVVLNRAFQLRAYLADRQQLTAWLKSVEGDPCGSATIGTEATRLLREIERAEQETSRPAIPQAPAILKEAEREAQSSPASLTALYAAGVLELAGRMPEARPHLESYAGLAQTAESWVEFSRACADQLCRFSALRNALKLEPANRDAQMELVDYYRQRGQREHVRQLLGSVLASFPTDFVARKIAADLLFEEGQEQGALEQYENLERQFGDVVWVKREVAAAYERLQLPRRALPLAEAALAANSTGAAEQALVIRLAQRTHEVARLRSAYEMIVRLNPADAPSVAQLAMLRARSGETKSAREMVDATIREHVGDPSLLDVALKLAPDAASGHYEEMKSAALAQKDAGLRRFVDWHHPDDAARKNIESSVFADAEEVLREAQADSAGGLRETAVLSEIRLDRVADNGLATTQVQQFWLAADRQAAQQFSTRSIQYSPDREALEILHARLHKKDGRVLEAEDAGESPVADRRVAMYYDQRSRQLHFPGCEAGDIVELEYRTTPLLGATPMAITLPR